jgi:integrase
MFIGCAKAAGLPESACTIQGTWASLALQAGVNPKVVSERLGHASVGFTLDTYSHVMPGLQQDAADAVASLVSWLAFAICLRSGRLSPTAW